MNRIGNIILFCFFFSVAIPAQNTLWRQADSLIQSADYFSAKAMLENFIASHKRNDFHLAKACDQLSYVYIQLQQPEKAEDLNEQSFDIKKRLRYEYFADNYMRLGTIRLQQKKYDKALDHYLEALDLPHETLEFTGRLYGYLGMTCARMGQPEKAIEFYKRAQSTLSAAFDKPYADMVSNDLQIGKLYLLKEEFADSEMMFNKALANDRLLDNTGLNPRRIALHNALGALQFYVYQNETSGLEHYQNALSLSNQLWGVHHPESVRCLANVIEVLRFRKDYSVAKEEVQKAIELLLPLGQTKSASRLYAQARMTDQPLLLRLLKQEAAISLSQYQETREEALLYQAYSASEEAATLFENLLDEVENVGTQGALLEQFTDIYEEGIQAAYQLHYETGDASWSEKAFILSERSKAGILKRMMQQAGRFDDLNLPAEWQAKQHLLQQQIAECDIKLATDFSNPELRRKMVAAKKEYQQFLDLVATEYPEYHRMFYQIATPNVADLQAQLDNKTAVLSYYMTKDLYYIFGISRDHFVTFAFPQDSILPGYDQKQKGEWLKFVLDKNKILEQIGGEVFSEYTSNLHPVSLKDGIGAHLGAIKKMQGEEFAYHSNRLYGKLIYPIKDLLRRKDHLIIIPHGDLYYLPFEALTTTKAEPPIKYSKLDYLVKDYAINYHYSVALFQQSIYDRSARPVMEERFLGMAPVFSDSSTTGYVWNSRDYVLEDSFYRFSGAQSLRYNALDGRQFKALMYSEGEVLQIAELFAKNKKESIALVHDKATEEAFKEKAQYFKYLHIASHSFADANFPALSGIAFAHAPFSESEEDGILHSPETFLLNLNADLLVLSSCESGTGKYVAGEGLMSLTRGFLYAGVPNMVCSMWKVYDSYTSKLMVLFYQQLLRGKTYSKSLRSAKLKMIRREKTAHPRKWSGFVLVGVE